MDQQENLHKYADLIVRVGLNLKAGDNLQIKFNIWGLELARLVADKAYEAGVGDVVLNFIDDSHTLSFYSKAKDVTYYPDFKARYLEELAEHGYHRLNIDAADPALLAQADPERVSQAERIKDQKTQKIMEYDFANLTKWCIAAVPSPAWARTVFPELGEAAAMDKLWEKIFAATRVDLADPVAAWGLHDARLKKVEAYLNAADFEKLVYRGPGTDLTVHLAKNHLWCGGSVRAISGELYFPNLPTEEVYTMPDSKRINGTLRSTKPLAVRGQIIEDIEFVIRDGLITEFSAQTGQAVLGHLLAADKGAARLGEVALVPDNSPIAKTGILFRKTLFDENASCHFALGAAFPENLKDGDRLTDEEKAEAGMNESLIHVDFMVGGPDVAVTGIHKDGREVLLLADGDWQI